MLKVFLKILFISFMFINLSYSAEIGNAKQIKFEQTLQDKINKFQNKLFKKRNKKKFKSKA